MKIISIYIKRARFSANATFLDIIIFVVRYDLSALDDLFLNIDSYTIIPILGPNAIQFYLAISLIYTVIYLFERLCAQIFTSTF